MKVPEKSLTLIVAGLGFLYFGWVFSATGVHAGAPRQATVAKAEEPSRFSFAVGAVYAAGVTSLAAGVLTVFRR